jgi:uncharacterized protein (DUF924 family)
MSDYNYQPVLDFWFTELSPKAWFSTSPDLDNQIKDRFLHLHEAAAKGKPIPVPEVGIVPAGSNG